MNRLNPRKWLDTVGAAAGCDLLILISGSFAKCKNQQIAACESAY